MQPVNQRVAVGSSTQGALPGQTGLQPAPSAPSRIPLPPNPAVLSGRTPCTCVDLTQHIGVGTPSLPLLNHPECHCEAVPPSRISVGDSSAQTQVPFNPPRTPQAPGNLPSVSPQPVCLEGSSCGSDHIQISAASLTAPFGIATSKVLETASTISQTIAPGIILFSCMHSTGTHIAEARRESSKLKKIGDIALAALSTTAAVYTIAEYGNTALLGASVLGGIYLLKETVIDRLFSKHKKAA